MTRTVIFVAAILMGCGSPLHLQYDHGRASDAAFNAQADRTRASVAGAAYPLTGTEAIESKARGFEKAPDAESGKAEYVQVIGVE